MPLRITVELIPRGDENAKMKLCVLDVINDGTGTHERGNYRVEAQGLTREGFDTGWDAWAGWPQRITGIDRQIGYEHVAASAMQLLLSNVALSGQESRREDGRNE